MSRFFSLSLSFFLFSPSDDSKNKNTRAGISTGRRGEGASFSKQTYDAALRRASLS